MRTKDPHRRPVRLTLKWAAPAVGVVALGLAAYFWFHTQQPGRHHLTMTAGPTVSTRHHLAELVRAEAAPRGIVLELRGTVGSEESLDQVNSRQLDCALVQGGLSVGERPNIRQVAVLPVEPLHLLVKADLADQVTGRLTALEGKTVDVGETGTGTHTLAVAVLSFAGLAPRTDTKPGYIPRQLSWEEMAATPTADMPDAIFMVSSLPSRRVKHLVGRHGYRLVPLPFGEAFALESLARDPGPFTAEHVIDNGRTHPTVIPAFTYGVEPPVPPAALPTLANRLLLVAHKDVDPRVVEQLIQVLFASEAASRVRPPVDPGHMDLPPEVPWHDGVEQYRRRNRPLVPGDVMELGQKGAAVLGVVASGAVVLVGWMLGRRKIRKALESRKVLNEVNRLDEETTRGAENGAMSPDQLVAARAQLIQLRAAALDRYADGELDDQLMACFLAHVNSSRDNLTRLIAQLRHGTVVVRPVARPEERPPQAQEAVPCEREPS
jgi:TRAP-type uncharacterized transport system substrate-binding protein